MARTCDRCAMRADHFAPYPGPVRRCRVEVRGVEWRLNLCPTDIRAYRDAGKAVEVEGEPSIGTVGK